MNLGQNHMEGVACLIIIQRIFKNLHAFFFRKNKIKTALYFKIIIKKCRILFFYYITTTTIYFQIGSLNSIETASFQRYQQ
jgi:hypothetical protein